MMNLHVLFILHIFLYDISFLTCNAVDEITIGRKLKDIFRIPSAMCQNDIDKQCNNMGAKKRTKLGGNQVNCTCQCNVNDNNVFGWFNNQWNCERNSAVRNYNLSGCLLKTFEGRTANGPLSIVTPYQDDSRPVGKIIGYGGSCYTDNNLFSYLDCESTWKTLKGNPFYFDVHDVLFIESKTDLDSMQSYNSTNIYGHIIKLGIRCENGSKYVYFCVVFKVRGQQKCPVVYPTTSTPTTAAKTSTSSKVPTTTSSTTQARPTTEKQTTTMSTTQVSTTNSITSIPLSATKQDTTEATTRDPKLTNKTDHSQKQNRESSDTDDDSGIIAGAIGGVAVLVAEK